MIGTSFFIKEELLSGAPPSLVGYDRLNLDCLSLSMQFMISSREQSLWAEKRYPKIGTGFRWIENAVIIPVRDFFI